MTLLQIIGENQPELAWNNVLFYCPGCKRTHPYRVIKPGRTEEEVRKSYPNGCWTWNGSMDKPTFSPSLLCDASYPEHRCHLFVRDGRIEYCGDCHHDLRGQTVDMVPIPEDWL